MVKECRGRIKSIYQIYFPVNNKSYIGQTFGLKGRIDEHLKANSLVGKALRKYSDWVVIELYVVNQEYANILETIEIARYNSMPPNGYNLTSGGGRSYLSEEARKNISKGKRGKKVPKISKLQTGRKHSKERCANMSKALVGRKFSKEHCKNISEALEGKKVPKRSEALKGKKRPDVSRRMLGAGNPMKKLENQEKMSRILKGRRCSWLIGDNNPMRDPAIALKCSNSRKRNHLAKLEKERGNNNEDLSKVDKEVVE